MVVSNPNFSTGANDYHIFAFDDTATESNNATVYTARPGGWFKYALLVARDDWDTADIGFQFQLKNDAVWRTLRADGEPVRCVGAIADAILVAPDALTKILTSGLIESIRLTSIATSTPFAGVAQSPATDVYMYFVK